MFTVGFIVDNNSEAKYILFIQQISTLPIDVETDLKERQHALARFYEAVYL